MLYSCPFYVRFIVHNDQNNPTLSSLEDFAEELILFSPTLLVIGGLQMMDNFPFKPGMWLHLFTLHTLYSTLMIHVWCTTVPLIILIQV